MRYDSPKLIVGSECGTTNPPPEQKCADPILFEKNARLKKCTKKSKVKGGTFLLHKSVDIEINRNVHRQKCAFARLPKVTKLCKAPLGHFSVDWYNYTFLSIVLKNVLTTSLVLVGMQL